MPTFARKAVCLAKSQEIIRLIGQADVAPGKGADAAGQAYGLFSFFLELQEYVHGALLDVFRVIVAFSGLTASKCNRVGSGAEGLNLPQSYWRNMSPSLSSSSRRMTLSRVPVLPLNSMRVPNEELLLLVEGKRQINQFWCRRECRCPAPP